MPSFTSADDTCNNAIVDTIAALPTNTAGGTTVSLDFLDDFGNMHAAEAREWLVVSINRKIGVTYTADPGVESTAATPDEPIRRAFNCDMPVIRHRNPTQYTCPARRAATS